jgi:hypothetical protein
MEADLDKRLTALESAIGLTAASNGSSLETASLKAEIAALQRKAQRDEYRILHLTRGLEHFRKLAEQASAKQAK